MVSAYAYASSSANARRCDVFFSLINPSRDIPTNSNRERSLIPVSAFDDWHLPVHVRAGSIEDLMRVAVFCGVELMGMGMGAGPVV